jgi:hypothetical protein
MTVEDAKAYLPQLWVQLGEVQWVESNLTLFPQQAQALRTALAFVLWGHSE